MELLQMVPDAPTLDKRNTVVLGLGSTILWEHVTKFVEASYQKYAAPWVGIELACAGTYLPDLPKPFMQDDLALNLASKTHVGNMCSARKFD